MWIFKMNIFNEVEYDFIESIIMYLGENMEIDIEKALSVFNIKTKSTSEHQDYLVKHDYQKCRVLLDNKKQCSRADKKNGFCLTHYKLVEENKIDKCRIIKSNQKTIFEKAVNNLKKARKIPALIQCKLIYYKKEEYLYDPVTNYVYDIEKYKKIGIMDSFRQIKFYEEI